MRNGAAELGRRLVQVAVPAESRADLSAHVCWKRGTTVMFDLRIFNLDSVSYLCMTPGKDIVKA